MYKAIVYEGDMTYEEALRVLRVRMWEKGHSFEEIDNMSITDLGDVIGYWSEVQRGEKRQSESRSRMRKGG